ncbi:NAD(P)H-dependent oxidoreductase [Janthinobacterium agaricidamnosum]|uniref:Nitroreductase family protein n=1 Tax=Janthinobacterium agaricidamnosum NBRC 102515 = DSM 9628 TaxID=1349767 RepID=W0VEV6_9BURK|nr:NAD(P)H-dependent oxidoreductase [Janthinobacterium agaricidamnosum]CDG85963.1 nitroreductase family protein [Janthinobacterium agaricidamnosum NBRC 102515 = DSM 9628]
MSNLINKLEWRYATKKFDPSKVVPREKLDRILEAVRLSASSSGLQPYEVLVVTNPAIRAQIKPIANHQSQITDSSYLLVFAAWDDVTAGRINMMFDLINKERGLAADASQDYRQYLLTTYAAAGAEANFQHAAGQAYIGLGSGLIAAAFEEVDSTPMGGFDPAALDRILGLREKNLRSVALLAVGYRETGADWLEPLKKVRRSREDFITEVN